MTTIAENFSLSISLWSKLHDNRKEWDISGAEVRIIKVGWDKNLADQFPYEIELGTGFGWAILTTPCVFLYSEL